MASTQIAPNDRRAAVAEELKYDMLDHPVKR
jgi:hypothetical protein